MNERLVEQRASADPAVRRAAELLASVTMPEPSAARMTRVRNRMHAQRGWKARAMRLVPAAIAFAILFGGAAGAAWLAQAPSRTPVQVPAQEPQPQREQRAPKLRAPDSTPEPEPAPEQAEAEGVIASRIKAALSVRTASPAKARAPSRPDQIEVTPAPEDGVELVVSALALSRKEHRPREALDQLARYLAEHPRGMLVEEALALSIEAAAETDPVRAIRFADEYLARFPAGRFATIARNAKRRFGD